MLALQSFKYFTVTTVSQGAQKEENCWLELPWNTALPPAGPSVPSAGHPPPASPWNPTNNLSIVAPGQLPTEPKHFPKIPYDELDPPQQFSDNRTTNSAAFCVYVQYAECMFMLLCVFDLRSSWFCFSRTCFISSMRLSSCFSCFSDERSTNTCWFCIFSSLWFRLCLWISCSRRKLRLFTCTNTNTHKCKHFQWWHWVTVQAAEQQVRAVTNDNFHSGLLISIKIRKERTRCHLPIA